MSFPKSAFFKIKKLRNFAFCLASPLELFPVGFKCSGFFHGLAQSLAPFGERVGRVAGAAAAHFYTEDASDFFEAIIDKDELLSVSFVKPDGLVDGHPASSKFDLFESMVQKTVNHLKATPELMAETAFIVTLDEGGGYYDSGYIQPLDFFGDGPRIPLIIVSDYTKGGHINHTYTDHVSILKFIERNWRLKPLTHRSRDNFPNPVSEKDNPYVPVNAPAIGDLFDMFDFHHDGRR